MTQPTRRDSTRDDIAALEGAYRMSSYFRRQRHTRGCQRCGCWLAVDQPDHWLCSPCQVAKARR